jgi:carnitine-CoA ligase
MTNLFDERPDNGHGRVFTGGPMPESGGFIERFVSLAQLEGERVFARFENQVLSFAHLHDQSDRIAAGLRRLGVARGERVAVMLANSPTALALLFALAKSGVVWVPLNVQLRAAGLRYILDHAEPRMVIARADLIPVIRGCGATLSEATLVAEGEVDGVLPLARLAAGSNRFDEELPQPEALFAISYTSGTTGAPKGVLMSHRMLRLAGEGARLVSDARDGDVLFMWEPLYHIGGSQLIVMPLLRRVILHMVSRFSAGRFWADVSAAGASHIHFLGGILQILLKQPPSALDRSHGVRIAWGGGCPAEVWRAVEERFGVQIRECYGMTEASSFTTYNDNGVVGSVGRPVPWFSVELIDANCGPAPAGERGEIVVRSQDPLAITQGYFRNPEATTHSLRGRALYTGDIGSWDSAGNLYFHGRLSDSVRVKGENVSAWEVESVAAGHPAVEDCAIIGVATEVGEQDIKLFVKLKPGHSLEPASLSRWLAERLAPYQIPRYVSLVEAFERTPSQRIMKHRLSTRRDDCWDRLAREGEMPCSSAGPGQMR